LPSEKHSLQKTKNKIDWEKRKQTKKRKRDYFDYRFYQNDPSTLKMIRNGEKNRLITVLWYMTNVTDGGETIFPKAFSVSVERSSRSG
jgi:hypothetical protein